MPTFYASTMGKAVIKAKIVGTVESAFFRNFIITVTILAGVLVGLETVPELVDRHGQILQVLDHFIIWVFIGEFLLKVSAEGSKPWRYFHDYWNVFDFIIIATFFLPLENNYLVVLRLVRLLRVLKLIRSLPRLQILVGALLKSVPSMGYVSALLSLLFYIYGVTATFLFSGNDPIHFRSLPISVLSLFQIITMEGWSDIMYTQMYGCDRYGYDGIEELCTNPAATPIIAALFFISFVMLGAMIVINLFTGVIVSSVEEAHQEQQAYGKTEYAPHADSSLDTHRLMAQLAEMQAQLQTLQATLEQQGKSPNSPNA